MNLRDEWDAIENAITGEEVKMKTLLDKIKALYAANKIYVYCAGIGIVVGIILAKTL